MEILKLTKTIQRELDQILNNLYSTEFFERYKNKFKNNTLKFL